MTDLVDTLPGEGPPAERGGVRRGLGLAAGSFGLSVVVALGSSVATSRLYGIEVIGEYALVSAPYLIVSQLSSVNEQTAFVREAAKLPRRDGRLCALFRAMLGFSFLLTATVAAVGMALGTVLLRGPIHRPDLVLPAAVILVAYTVIDNTNWNLDSVFSAFRAGEVLFLARALEVTTFLVAGVALITVWRSVWGLVVATVLSFLVPLVVRLAAAPRYVTLRVSGDDHRRAMKELPGLLRFGAVLLPARLVNGGVQQAGTWMVGSVGSVVATGAYSRALGLSSKLSEAGYRIIEILLPGMVERGQHDEAGAARLLVRTVRLCAVGLLVVTAPGAGAASGVLAVFGAGFDRASAVLALLVGAYTLSVLTSVQSQGYLASGHPGRVTRLSITRSAISLALLLPLGLRYGAGGVGIAYLVGPSVEFLLYDRALARHLHLGRRSLLGGRRLAALGGAWAGAYATSWGILRLSTSIVATGLAVAAGTLVALVLVVLFHLVEPDERRELTDRVRGMVRR